jgi:hypothetical protein
MVQARQGSFGDALSSRTYVYDMYHSPLREIQQSQVLEAIGR